MDNLPEHSKRNKIPATDQHPEIKAAYEYVDNVAHTSDYNEPKAWHGWALREAFLAGISYAQSKPPNASVQPPARKGPEK